MFYTKTKLESLPVTVFVFIFKEHLFCNFILLNKFSLNANKHMCFKARLTSFSC